MLIRLSTAAVAATIFASLSATPSQASALHHRHHSKVHHASVHGPVVSQATRNSVQDMIKASAPGFGVPTWFAMKIAQVESGYNPQVTGSAGEIGVFQLKCQTARGIGYTGSCSGLYNPATNVQYGLKYLSMAVKSSHGNLKLAASKHNGGLGCNHIVKSYVAMVF
jgi:soluble lytic murein transglycosylase-like protein